MSGRIQGLKNDTRPPIKAIPIFKEVFEMNDQWKQVLVRITGTDLFPVSEEDFNMIVD